MTQAVRTQLTSEGMELRTALCRHAEQCTADVAARLATTTAHIAKEVCMNVMADLMSDGTLPLAQGANARSAPSSDSGGEALLALLGTVATDLREVKAELSAQAFHNQCMSADITALRQERERAGVTSTAGDGDGVEELEARLVAVEVAVRSAAVANAKGFADVRQQLETSAQQQQNSSPSRVAPVWSVEALESMASTVESVAAQTAAVQVRT